MADAGKLGAKCSEDYQYYLDVETDGLVNPHALAQISAMPSAISLGEACALNHGEGEAVVVGVHSGMNLLEPPRRRELCSP